MRDEQHVHDDLTARFEKLRGMLRRIATCRSAAHHVGGAGRIAILSTCSPPREPAAHATARVVRTRRSL
jgi:hypothetical protein